MGENMKKAEVPSAPTQSHLFGHQRSPSMEFKELTQKDAQLSLSIELDKLLRTIPEGHKQTVDQDFTGFKKLFGKICQRKLVLLFAGKKLRNSLQNAYSYHMPVSPTPDDKEAISSMLDRS
eukprot:TRINITY_DN4649_c0_g1_i1.p1 TRINITY_DN4649_c0_g1~~TRINITY_DN4649_c0_g1_i1.p1  ORF type:complete len:121 (-),score=28.16 TRINITY_DN4649_c0_g1_i1:29-391(-)